MRKAAVNRSPHRLVKAAVQKISVMGIRIDQDLAAKLLQFFQKEAVGIQFRLPAPVKGAAVDLKGNIPGDKILHGLQSGPVIAGVRFVQIMPVIVEARNQVKMPYKGAVQPVINLCLKFIISF